MASRTFYTYLRINGSLVNADGDVTLKVLNVNTGSYVVGGVSSTETMINLSTGTYEYVSGDVFSPGINYTVTYYATIDGNNYSYSENFTVDAAGNQLFSLAELKKELNIATTISDYDMILTILVEAVPQLFEEYIDNKINQGLNTDKNYNEVGDRIFLSAIPVTSINSIVLKEISTGVTSAPSYTILNYKFGEILLDEPIAEGEELSTIFVGGLIPNSTLKYAALTQAKYMYQRHQAQQIAIDTHTTSQGRMIFKNDAILPIVKMILDPIRRVG